MKENKPTNQPENRTTTTTKPHTQSDLRAGEMAQWAKHLPANLCLIPGRKQSGRRDLTPQSCLQTSPQHVCTLTHVSPHPHSNK